MKLVYSFLLSILLFFIFTNDSKAIIIVVPVVLVPIVKIMALIIGAIATPVISLSAYYLKSKNKSIYFGIFIGVLLLIVIGFLMFIGFKIVNPQRPTF